MEGNNNQNKSFSLGCIQLVKKYSKKLNLPTILNRFKKKGDKLSNITEGLITHKITFSRSINKASEWLNEPQIRLEFSLNENVPKTFYRTLEILGRHDKSIQTLIQNRIGESYKFPNTDSNMDWSSIVYNGTHAAYAAFGYSRDHRPDRRQLTFGLSQLREPRIPIAFSVAEGNKLDKQHFELTFKRTLKALDLGSLIVMDKGANTKENKALILDKKHHYLCAASLSVKVDEQIKAFNKARAVEVEDKKGQKTYCQTYEANNEFGYLYFSEKLYADCIKRKRSLAQKLASEGKEIEERLLSKRKKKKKLRNTPSYLVEDRAELQQRLKRMSQEKLADLLFQQSIDGREGFFLLKSSKNLTPKEALTTYRSRDAIEKLMDSIKNTVQIKPVRVWTSEAIRGAILIGFIAQLILDLFQYDNPDFRKFREKTVLHSLRNLTVTIEYLPEFRHRRIISNIDSINSAVFDPKTAGT